MGKQDGPAISDPFVKVDFALRCFRREIRRFIIYAQHAFSPAIVFYPVWMTGGLPADLGV
jgi:hypothetical protein